jgi:hypothetical protein
MIIDDITPLRQLSKETLQQDVAFLKSRPYKVGYLGWEMGLTGDDEFVGSNPPGASIISYYLKKRHIFGEMHLEIYNEDGEKIKELPAGKRKGINRVPWHMRMKPPKVPRSPLLAFQAMYGPSYPPGEYTVKMIKKDTVFESTINVVYDETIPHSTADRDARLKTLMEAYNLLQDLAYLDKLITGTGEQAKEKSAKANNKSLGKKLTGISGKMELRHKELAATTATGAITGEEKLREKIGNIYSAVLGYQGKPTQSQINRLNNLTTEYSTHKQWMDNFMEKDIPTLNKELGKEEIPGFTFISKEEFLKEEK